MGEGWGEGDKQSRYNQLLPLPLVPSLQGRGERNVPFLSIIMPTSRHSGAFYECIKVTARHVYWSSRPHKEVIYEVI